MLTQTIKLTRKKGNKGGSFGFKTMYLVGAYLNTKGADDCLWYMSITDTGEMIEISPKDIDRELKANYTFRLFS